MPLWSPDFRTLISEWNAKLTFFWIEDFTSNSVLFILSRQTFLAQALIQDWLDMNATVVAPLLKMSVYGGSCCTDTSLKPPAWSSPDYRLFFSTLIFFDWALSEQPAFFRQLPSCGEVDNDHHHLDRYQISSHPNDCDMWHLLNKTKRSILLTPSEWFINHLKILKSLNISLYM